MEGNGIGVGNIISGVIGAAAVVLVAYLREYLDKRTRRRKLRRALYAEIQSTNTLDAAVGMLKSSSGQYFYTQHDFIPTDVYQSNLADIGLLSEEEIESVIEHYSKAIIAKEERKGCAKVMDSEESSYDQQSSAVGSFKNTLSYLQDTRQDAMESLEYHLEIVPNEEENVSEEISEVEEEEVVAAHNPENSTTLAVFKDITYDLLQPWRIVWQRTSATESILAFLLIPFILTAVGASVDPQSWALPLSAETILQPEIFPLALTSSYVHTGPTHLWGNIQGYILIMSALFPVAVLGGRKRELFAVSLTNLLIVPFLVSWASLILPYPNYSLGFSGTNAAFLGSLLVFLFVDWSAEEGTFSPVWSLAPGLISLAVAFSFAPIVSPQLPLLSGYIFTFGAIGIIILTLFFRRVGFGPLQRFNPYQNYVMFWGALVSILGFMGLFILVPPSTNVLAHLTGFYIGFFLPFSVFASRTLNHPIIERVQTIWDDI